MSGRIDLHVHTTASDGQQSPAEVVQAALSLGLAAIAITDHDSTEGVEPAMEAARGTTLLVIPGVEISTETARSEVHVLGYHIAYRDPCLCSKLALFRQARLHRAQEMAAKLTRMGLPVALEEVQEMAGGAAVGRPHVAMVMLQKGYVSSVDEAFNLYIGRNGPAYAERLKLSAVEAVQTVLDAGGLPVLAHPLRVTHLLPELISSGLAGLEVYYPGYAAEETELLLDLAAKYGLIVTGGSDYHGPDVLPGNVLGGVPVPLSALQALQAHERRPSVCAGS